MSTGRLTGLLTGLTVLVTMWASPVSAQASDDYSGFFSQRELAQAGWSTCAPLTWSVDVSGLTPRQARGEIRRMKRAWGAWSLASGLSVEFTGRQSLAFDPRTNGLRAVDGSAQPERHVYIAFATRAQVPIMGRHTVGLAMPTAAVYATQEITGGMAIFRRGYVKEQRRQAPNRLVNAYLHELGHTLGLGHAANSANVMHSTLTGATALGDGDRAGITAYTHGCARAT